MTDAMEVVAEEGLSRRDPSQTVPVCEGEPQTRGLTMRN